MSLIYIDSFTPGGIVKDGLVLHLDAAQPSSYPGSGTTWTDLSGNGNNGTLSQPNGPTFDSANGGSLSFDGVDDYSSVPPTNGLDLSGTSTSITVSCWAKTTDTGLALQGLVMWEDVDDSDGIEPVRLAITSNSNNYPAFILRRYDNNGSSNVSGLTLTSQNTYYNIVGTYNGSTHAIYVNGTLSNQTSYTGGIKVPADGTNAKWIIGRGELTRTDRLLKGNMAQVLIYNRGLSAAEVTQNYNALKSRYGL